MPADTLAIILVFALLGIIGLTAFGIYNRLVRSQERTTEAWSGIDVQLRRRTSLIPNLVETVKGYATHEKGVFEEVTKARAALQQAGGAAEAAKANDMLSGALARLFAVVENYPQLRASENFMSLQEELSDVEEKIAYARQFYNRNAAEFNADIRSVPNVVIARVASFERFEFFEAEEGTRADVQVSFTPPSEPPAPEPPSPPAM
jgi:LemA protein